jgi:mRNA-degrading endonuclease RelE of RelBE toxin-antitoxin system
MGYDIKVSSWFSKEAKHLSKKYHSFAEDLQDFFDSISSDPLQGVEIAPHIRKIRMQIKSKGKGKSGGARIITYTVLASETGEGKLFLLAIYDKEDASNIRLEVLKDILKEMGT